MATVYEAFHQTKLLVWYKGTEVGGGSPTRLQHEFIMAGFPKNAWKRDGSIGSAFQCPWPRGKRRRHPAEKPVKLLAELIDCFCPPEGRVLDHFAGSGSTQEAAWEMGRKCDPIDMDEP